MVVTKIGAMSLDIRKDSREKYSCGVILKPEIWLSNFGNDETGDGSKQNPFLTAERAMIEVRKSKVPVYVKISTEKKHD